MKRTRLFGSNRNLKVLMLALVALGATGLGIAAYATSLLRTLDLNTMNSRFAIRGNQRPHLEHPRGQDRLEHAPEHPVRNGRSRARSTAR